MSDVIFVVPNEAPTLYHEFCGTLLLATILKQNNTDVDIYRFTEASMSNGFFPFIDETAKNIVAKGPKIVSFYCRCDCYLTNIMIAKKIKETNPDIYVIFGGPQADASAYDTINEIPWVDFCCRGEGETTVYTLFSALLNKTDYSAIKGLTYKDNNQNIVENPAPELVEDLDSLPFTDYSLIPDYIVNNPESYDHAFPIDVGRGCPFNCAYCSTSIFWQRKFRVKSADRIVKEMLDLNKHFNITKFNFQHDLFTVDKKKVLNFTSALSEAGSPFEWSCSSRVDTLDEETIVSMAENGMRSVYLGIETGSERMQKLINKNLKIDKIIETIDIFIKNKVNVTASFMFGFPEETQEDLEKTLQLVLKLYRMGVQKFQFHLCSITPGTLYYYKYFDKLTLAINQSDQVGDFGIEECRDFIKEHIKLFSYCYEYKSELRDRFANLHQCAIPAIITYNLLSSFFPKLFQNIRISDVLLEILDIYSKKPDFSYNSDFALEYVKNHFSGDTLTKLTDIFNYHKLNDRAILEENFEPSVEYFSTDIQAYRNGEAFENIPLKNQMLYFFKADKKLHIKYVNLQ